MSKFDTFQPSSQSLIVQEWLKELFAPGEVPKFEESDAIYEALMELRSKNLDADGKAQVKINMEKHFSQLYKMKSDAIASCMLGFELSRETIEDVESLASVAEQLALKEPTIANFTNAASNITLTKMKKSEESTGRAHHLSKLSDKIVAAIDVNISLDREVNYLEGVLECQKDYKKLVDFEKLDKGMKKDTIRSEIYEKEIAEAEFDKSLSHHKLVEKNKELLIIKSEVKDLTTRRNRFKDLPANVALTKERIDDIAQAIAKKEKELDKLINEIE